MTATNADDSGAPQAGASPAAARPVRRKRSAKRQMAATTLATESLMVVFGTLVAYGLRVAPAGPLWLAGGALALVLLLLSGMLGRPGGYLAGSLVQLPVLASGFVLLAAPVTGAGFGAVILFVLAAVFVTLWVVSLRLGGRIDRERAAYDAAHPA